MLVSLLMRAGGGSATPPAQLRSGRGQLGCPQSCAHTAEHTGWGGRAHLQPSVQGSMISDQNTAFLDKVSPTDSTLLASGTEPQED